MRTRKIGHLEVSAVGLGTMGFSHGYGPGVGDDEAVDLMRAAFDLGCTFYDTAQSYAAGENERLVGRALAPIRESCDRDEVPCRRIGLGSGGRPADSGPPGGITDASGDRAR